MKTFREIRNLQEAPLTSRFVAGDKLWKSTGGNGDYPDLGKVNYDPTKKFHSVGKPVVVHAMRDGFHEDFIFYSDGKYVLVVSGHKQVADARGSSDEAMMYMVDAGGGFSPADLKKFAMKNAKAYMDRVLKVTDKVRDFSKEDEGSDSAPKSIKRVPFKESVKIKETKESKFRSFRADLKNIAEAAGFEFVDMDKKSRDTVIALAKKFKLKVKERKKGSLSNIDVEGSNANVAKFMQNLPQDALEGVQKEATSISMKDIMRKHGRELKKVARTGNLELSDRAEEDLVNWAYDNGEVMTDDPDEFIEWLDNNIDDIVKGRIR